MFEETERINLLAPYPFSTLSIFIKTRSSFDNTLFVYQHQGGYITPEEKNKTDMQTDQTVALRFPIRTRPAGEITERYRLGFTFYAPAIS